MISLFEPLLTLALNLSLSQTLTQTLADDATRASQVLVSTTGGDTYTAQQLPKLLDDLGLHQQAAVFGTVRKLTVLDRADFRVCHVAH